MATAILNYSVQNFGHSRGQVRFYRMSLKNSIGLDLSVCKQMEELTRSATSRDALASALACGAENKRQMERKEFSFVWSGPTRYLEARRTEQVILDIINFATERLLLVSYAAYRIPVLLEGLQKAIDRGIKVRFVLETEEDSMGHLRQDASDAFESIHGAEFFHWPIEKRDNTNGHGVPVMHAKCVIS